MPAASTTTTHENLDIGRPLRRSDIVARDVMPLEESDVGCFCYGCQEPTGNVTGLTALTRSSGVFTSRRLCGLEAPVYLCLECIPFSRAEFEVFTPDVAVILHAERYVRDHPVASA